MLLSQPEFSFSARGPFTKNKERMQKFKETGDSRYVYQNELDNTCFRHDMAYEDFKDLPQRISSDKILRDKAFNIAKNPKHDPYLASMIYKLFEERSSSSIFRWCC